MIHSIIDLSLRLRTLVVALAAVLAIAGVWHMRSVPLDVVPEFSPIKLVVKTEALGLSSTEVEALITVPIEADLLNGVPWLQTIQSESTTGLSSIEMTFAPGTDYMRARQMVQERLTQAHALPNVSRPPTLLQPISSTGRLMNIGLSSKTVSPIELSVLARWTIVPRLLGVPGVANVAIWGQRDRQLQVIVDPKTMREHGITLAQIVKTAGEAVWASPLTYLNSSTPGTGGFIDTPNQRLNIRHQAPIATPKDFARVPVHGTSIALGDAAKVVEGHQPLIGDALLKDGPGLILVVDRFPGFNTQHVTRDLEAALRELKPGMTGIDVDTDIYRPASYIERATDNLSGALLAAAVLLAIGLAVLLGSWQSAVVAAVTIALSLLAALLVLNLRGVNVNMLVLAGLLAAIGAVVHDAILVVATIRRRVDDARNSAIRKPSTRIILEAAIETRRPMMFATLIIVIAVVPLLFMQGLAAAFFEPLVWSYIVAVVAATVVSLIVVPALSLLLLPRSLGGGQRASESHSAPAPKLIAPLLRTYEHRLGPTLRSPVLPFGIAIAALGLGYAMWTPLERSMLPTFQETNVVIDVQSAPGTSLPAMNRSTTALMRDLRTVGGVRNVAALVGRAVLCNCDETADVNSAELWVSIDPAANYRQALASIEEVLDSSVGMTGEVGTYLSKKMREALTGREETLTVRVYGHDLEIIRGKAEEIRKILESVKGVEDIRVEQAAAEPTLEVEVDLERAGKHGLKPGDIRRATSALVSGITVGALFQDQKVFDVVVWGAPEIRDNLSDIKGLMIDTEDDEQVRLGDVANVRIGKSDSVIRRQGVSRRIDIDADVEGRPLSDVTREVARRIGDVQFPFEYHAQVLGEHVERRTALRSIYPHLIVAAVLIFLLLQVALGSWRLAALSLLGIPVALFGGLVATWISGGTLSLGSLIGFVTVLGLTVRNPIMVVKHFQTLEQTGAEKFGEALVRRGVREQFVPVVASAIVVGLAVLPFVLLGSIAGLEIAHPMAVVILGGVVTSTVVTLVMTPALYLKFGAATAADELHLEEAKV
jgi:CzcA family heavy metal efflux pump